MPIYEEVMSETITLVFKDHTSKTMEWHLPLRPEIYFPVYRPLHANVDPSSTVDIQKLTMRRVSDAPTVYVEK